MAQVSTQLHTDESMNAKVINFKLGELFCGPGGLALGAFSSTVDHVKHIFQIEHAWANDIDSDTCETYRRNLCPDSPATVICKDIRDLDISSLEPIDAFAYGFPCNDFSVVGERKGINGKYGPLYSYGVEVINRFRPKFFLAENVGGIRSANEGNAFKQILNALRHAGNGYILTAHLYRAEDYGVPQTRHRLIIVGIDKKYKLHFQVPRPITAGSPISARQALENPPIPLGAKNNEFTVQSQKVVERLKYTKPGQNAWNADLPDHLKLNVKNTKLSHIYRRLDPDRPSYTITGSGGGGTHGYHWSENRALTNRERARIQTFPDDFCFIGSKESVRKQIGMAVPVQLAKVIFNAVLKTFAGIKYQTVPTNTQDVGQNELLK